MNQKFQDLLQRYELRAFHREHDRQNEDELSRRCLHITEDVPERKYHHHFQRLPDADRAEILNMVQNYVCEAILPPVVEKLMARQVRLETMQLFQRELLDVPGQPAARCAGSVVVSAGSFFHLVPRLDRAPRMPAGLADSTWGGVIGSRHERP